MRQGIVPDHLELVPVLSITDHLGQRQIIILNDICACLESDLRGLLRYDGRITLEELLSDLAQFLFFKRS